MGTGFAAVARPCGADARILAPTTRCTTASSWLAVRCCFDDRPRCESICPRAKNPTFPVARSRGHAATHAEAAEILRRPWRACATRPSCSRRLLQTGCTMDRLLSGRRTRTPTHDPRRVRCLGRLTWTTAWRACPRKAGAADASAALGGRAARCSAAGLRALPAARRCRLPARQARALRRRLGDALHLLVGRLSPLRAARLRRAAAAAAGHLLLEVCKRAGGAAARRDPPRVSRRPLRRRPRAADPTGRRRLLQLGDLDGGGQEARRGLSRRVRPRVRRRRRAPVDGICGRRDDGRRAREWHRPHEQDAPRQRAPPAGVPRLLAAEHAASPTAASSFCRSASRSSLWTTCSPTTATRAMRRRAKSRSSRCAPSARR